ARGTETALSCTALPGTSSLSPIPAVNPKPCCKRTLPERTPLHTLYRAAASFSTTRTILRRLPAHTLRISTACGPGESSMPTPESNTTTQRNCSLSIKAHCLHRTSIRLAQNSQGNETLLQNT